MRSAGREMLDDYAIIKQTDPEVFLQGLKVKRKKKRALLEFLQSTCNLKGKKSLRLHVLV